MRTYSEEIIREFYAFYVGTLRGSIDRRERPSKKDPLTNIKIWDIRLTFLSLPLDVL